MKRGTWRNKAVLRRATKPNSPETKKVKTKLLLQGKEYNGKQCSEKVCTYQQMGSDSKSWTPAKEKILSP